IYNYFREYDPAIGRNIESDPIGLGGGLNTFAYAGNNALSYADPTGKFLTSVDAACAIDPQFCSEIMGQIVENAGELSGDSCLAQEANDVADGLRTVGLVATVLPIVGVAARAAINPKIYDQLGKQLARHGANSIHKALRSAETTLAEHQAKLQQILKD